MGSKEKQADSEKIDEERILKKVQKHKLKILKSTYLYKSLNYSKLVSDEILRHDRDENIDEAVFLKNKHLTKETLSQLMRIKLKHPIESYLVLKRPLTVEDIFSDFEQFGTALFKGSKVKFSKIKNEFKKPIFSLKDKKVVLKQLAILKLENGRKYKDMVMTALLNYVIESQRSDKTKNYKDSILGGLFHDIGFLYLDDKYKNRRSSGFSIQDLKNVQAHAELGHYLLKPWFSKEISSSAMNHHVGEDKSGYPRQSVIEPTRTSKLTGFSSAFISCLRKYNLRNALKIQDIYSREKSYFGEKLTPFYKREFYTILDSLDIKYNKEGQNVDIAFNRKYSVVLHNFLVYLFDLGHELGKVDKFLLNYTEKSSHRLELQNDIDDIFDHIKKLDIIIKSCGKSPGLRKIMANNLMASKILGDIEIITMELHRNNQFLSGLFSYLNTKTSDFSFENSVYKKSREFSDNITRNISSQVEKEVSIFSLLNAIGS